MERDEITESRQDVTLQSAAFFSSYSRRPGNQRVREAAGEESTWM